MKESQPQIQGDGEVVIQGDITPEQFETYLAKFRRVTRSQGNAPKYTHVRIKGGELAGRYNRLRSGDSAGCPPTFPA